MEGFVVISHGSTWSTQGSQPGLSVIACFLILPSDWQKSHNPESEWNGWLGWDSAVTGANLRHAGGLS